MKLLTKLINRLYKSRDRHVVLMDMVELCMDQQKNIIDDHRFLCKDVVTVIGAHNQLHISQRHSIQSLATELYVLRQHQGLALGDDVNVM